MGKRGEIIKPTIWIDFRAYNLMSYWALLAGKKSQEFTCLGTTTIEEGEIIVNDAFLIEHVGTTGGVDGDEDSIVKLMMELDEKGITPDQIRCWVHSHPGTGPSATYLSGIDEANIERWLTGEFLVSIVFDSKGENPYTRLDLLAPRISIESNLEIHNEPWLSKKDKKMADKEFEEKAKSRSYSRGGSHYGQGNYMGGGYGGPYSGSRHTGGSYGNQASKGSNSSSSSKGGSSSSSSSSGSSQGGGSQQKGNSQSNGQRHTHAGRDGFLIHGYGWDWDDDDETAAYWEAMGETGKSPSEAKKDVDKSKEEKAKRESESDGKNLALVQSGVPVVVVDSDTDEIDIELVTNLKEMEFVISKEIDQIAAKCMDGRITDFKDAVSQIAALGIDEDTAWEELKQRLVA